MRRSDIALYEAKRERARFCAYSNEDEDTHTPQRLTILTDLRSAVEDDQLFLVYQPKIDVATGEVRGVEALVRWNHPTRGILYPDAFIPLAENTGLIAPITFFVVERALRQVRTWQEAGHRPVGGGQPLGPAPHRHEPAGPDRGRPRTLGSGARPSWSSR